MVTSATGLQSSRLFFIKERVTGIHFLVDTGAELSVIPRSLTAGTPQSSPQPGLTLQAINHSPIMTFGNCSITLNIGLRRSFRWMFVIADIKHAILGADFLRHYNLLVDVKHSALIDTLTHLQVHGLLTQEASPSPSLPDVVPQDVLATILAEFPSIVRPTTRNSPYSME